MTEIWKERLNVNSSTNMDLPKGAKVLSTAWKDDNISIFIEVNPNADLVSRKFTTVGTGWDVPTNMEFKGTVLTTSRGVTEAYHVYEKAEALTCKPVKTLSKREEILDNQYIVNKNESLEHVNSGDFVKLFGQGATFHMWLEVHSYTQGDLIKSEERVLRKSIK